MIQSDNLVSRLEVEDIRKAFPSEAQDFTPWLEENIDALSERIGLEGLAVIQREHQVGAFQVDLLCKDRDGNRVIIENQLEKTDHDHLSKLLTYLVNLDAKIAIWVTPEPHPEHQKVIDWLNQVTGADMAFYLVRVEAGRIGDSPFAPLFTVLAGPSEQIRAIGEEKKELAERDKRLREFWDGLLKKSREKTKLFSNISPSRYQWIATGAGKSGVTFNYTVGTDWALVELYIDHDHDTGAKNKAIFDALYAQKDEIEASFGEPLDWRRLDDRRASRIVRPFTHGGWNSPETWPELQDAMIEAMIKLDKTLRSRLAKINV